LHISSIATSAHDCFSQFLTEEFDLVYQEEPLPLTADPKPLGGDQFHKLLQLLCGNLSGIIGHYTMPVFVNQIFVELGTGFPFAMCTWIGSPFSFDQK
jgi:hypothetical protein